MKPASDFPRPESAPPPAMSRLDFARWHANDTVFTRRVLVNGTPGFAVYGADGTFLDVTTSYGEVLIAAHSNGMDVAAVH